MGRYSFLWAPGSLSCCCVLVSSLTNKPAFLKGSVLDCILQRQAELQRIGENQGGKEGENGWFKPASGLGWEVGVGYYYHPHYRDEETQSDLSEVLGKWQSWDSKPGSLAPQSNCLKSL